ncbi:glutathione S-transferase N-terminal domain-containing protein [Marinobacter mobilis]|uniref:Glutathione S-transferase, N-terminal domain n=1 Tax=Marinobacter mobilis TaxID=488533 RepID=A0A1H2ZXP5_9GAMM|nr:glutathione S-transferase N-terminal domain-containing protein [Marinobacter mobilis]SDX22332.1 Glutathione S-transferase, N-terminal domain [Marinobacter mobilis]
MPNVVTHNLHVLASVATSSLTGWRGCMVVSHVDQPAKPLVLYDMEACPYCRRVREVLSALHLDVEIRPCPKGGTRFRDEAAAIGGKQLFPLLVDENTGKVLYESNDIVEYLFKEYGKGYVPKTYRPRVYQPVLSSLASAASGLRGLRAKPAKVPEQTLRLWSFEGSPFSRLVREKLCEYEIPYSLHNIGKEHWTEVGPAKQRLKPGVYKPLPGGKRESFFARHQRVQVPYLEDPNTGAELFESARILRYLDETYGA